MAKYHVGVDMGKDRHHVCIRDLSDDTCKTFSITNDHKGFMECVLSLGKFSRDKGDFLVGVEACSHGLIYRQCVDKRLPCTKPSGPTSAFREKMQRLPLRQAQ